MHRTNVVFIIEWPSALALGIAATKIENYNFIQQQRMWPDSSDHSDATKEHNSCITNDHNACIMGDHSSQQTLQKPVNTDRQYNC